MTKPRRLPALLTAPACALALTGALLWSAPVAAATEGGVELSFMNCAPSGEECDSEDLAFTWNGDSGCKGGGFGSLMLEVHATNKTGDTVDVYTNGDCSGTPVATVGAGQENHFNWPGNADKASVRPRA
ncbi:hypothetical protein [Kitasatospora sp. NPDC093806]|uniref:hypothetical protein n=1 Tax=Kitasatospora sp. NPDC093806 TaxID=3155075 RepID=UPI0034339EF2